MNIRYLCVFLYIAGTVAEDAMPCCSPGLFLSKNITCWRPGSDYTEKLKINCTSGIIRPEPEVIVENGSLVLPRGGYDAETGRSIDLIVPNESYCIANRTNKLGTLFFKRAYVCLKERDDVEYHGYLMIVSVLFLTLTIIIYSSLSELRSSLLDKSYINLCLSLAVGLLLLLIMKIMDTNLGNMAVCAARGYLAYYFMIASFFWTNSISFQVFQSVRSPVNVTGTGLNKFAWHAAFAWGTPLILTLIMLVINYHPGLPIHVKAGIGLQHCWFFHQQQWYYMYSVMIIIITLNILMFSYSAYILWRNTFAASQVASLKQKFCQTSKLLVVMGILWIIEIIVNIGYAAQSSFWDILSSVNSLEGIWIFLVLVVFRNKTIKALHKHGWLFCFSDAVEKRCLASDEADDEIIEHTMVPMNIR